MDVHLEINNLRAVETLHSTSATSPQHALGPTLHLGELRLSIVHHTWQLGDARMMGDMEAIGVHHHHGETISFDCPVDGDLHATSAVFCRSITFPANPDQTVVIKSTYAHLSSLLGTSCLVFPLGHGSSSLTRDCGFLKCPFWTYH